MSAHGLALLIIDTLLISMSFSSSSLEVVMLMANLWVV